MWLKNNWKLVLSLILIIGLSWIELQHVSEATGVGAMKRRIFHLVFLGGVYAAGIFYWHQHKIHWVKYVWTLGYASLVVRLMLVGLVQWKFDIVSADVLDQIRHLRVFFSSPLPFIILLVIPKMERSFAGTSQRLGVRENKS